jgi:hypothetical protein
MRDPAPEPEWRLPDQPDPAPGRRPVHAVLISLVALAVLCCGGVGAVRALTGGDSPEAGPVSGEWREATPSAPAALLPVPRVPVRISVSKTPKAPKASRTKRPSTRPATKATKTPTRRPAPAPTAAGPIVRAGAFCAPVGAIGYTAKGKMMRCTRRPGDLRARWRAV